MLFSNTKIVIFLKRNSLDIFNEKGNLLAQVDLDNKLIYNLEIINIEGLNSLLTTKLKTISIKKAEVIMVLANEVVFFKSYSSDSKKDDIAVFMDKVPFELNTLVSKQLVLQGWLLYMAINKGYPAPFVDIFTKLGWTTKAIVLGSLYNNQISQSLNESQIHQILENDHLLKSYNLL